VGINYYTVFIRSADDEWAVLADGVQREDVTGWALCGGLFQNPCVMPLHQMKGAIIAGIPGSRLHI